ETVIAVAGAPELAEDGVNPDTVGAGFKTLTLKPVEPPPGGLLVISPFSVPGVCVSAALNANVIVFPETTPLALPSEELEFAIIPVPTTVTVVAPDPAGIEAGLTL